MSCCIPSRTVICMRVPTGRFRSLKVVIRLNLKKLRSNQVSNCQVIDNKYSNLNRELHYFNFIYKLYLSSLSMRLAS